MITDHGFAQLWAGRSDRWALVRQVFADWRTPLAPGDGVPVERIAEAERRLGFALPVALREWYAMAGLRDDLKGRGNHPLPPERLALRTRTDEEQEPSMLVFYQENQCVYWWAVCRADFERADPPVYVAEAGDDEWIQEDPTLSQFMLQMTLLETQFVAPFCANAVIDADLINVIERAYEDLGLTWWHWPAYPGRRFARPDVLINTDGAGQQAWVGVAARTESARARVIELLDGAHAVNRSRG